MNALSKEEASEREKLIEKLKEHGYVMAGAAAALGIHETTVLRRVRRYGLDALVEEHNPRTRALRENRELPPAPHEPSRQARQQQENRDAGLCRCGRPVDPDRKYQRKRPSTSCAHCRAGWRKRKGGAA